MKVENGKVELRLTHWSLSLETNQFEQIDTVYEFPEASYRSLVVVVASKLKVELAKMVEGMEWWVAKRVGCNIEHNKIKIAVHDFWRDEESTSFFVRLLDLSGLTNKRKCLLYNVVRDALKLLLKRVDFADVWGCKYFFDGKDIQVVIPTTYTRAIVSKWSEAN